MFRIPFHPLYRRESPAGNPQPRAPAPAGSCVFFAAGRGSLPTAFLLSTFLCLGCGDSSHKEEPLFVFAAVADPHVVEESRSGHDDARYLKALTISLKLLRNSVQDINGHRPPVDFVIVLGDISDHGYLRELQLAKAVLDSLSPPYYPVRGNHDARQDYWEMVFGEDRLNYAFDHEAFHFVIVDCCVAGRGGPEVRWGEDAREWLRQDLQAHSTMPTFFFNHANLYERTWSAAFDQREVYGVHGGADELRAILSEAGNVVAAVSGHVHANRLEIHEGLPCVEVGATCIARSSVRYFYVYRDRTEMISEYLSDRELQQYAEEVARRTPRLDDVGAALALVDGCPEDRSAVLPHPMMPADADGGSPLQVVLDVDL